MHLIILRASALRRNACLPHFVFFRGFRGQLSFSGLLAQCLPEFVMEVVEGAVEQLHGAVDEMATATAGQHGAEIFQGGEVGCSAAPGVDPVQQAAYGGCAPLSRVSW